MSLKGFQNVFNIPLKGFFEGFLMVCHLLEVSPPARSARHLLEVSKRPSKGFLKAFTRSSKALNVGAHPLPVSKPETHEKLPYFHSCHRRRATLCASL